MPLPAAGAVWPPKEIQPVTARLATWSAWYTGDTDFLSAIYGGSTAGDPGVPITGGWLNPNLPGIRGWLGSTLARWFWGTTTPDGERRTKLHLPIAGDIATTSADMLFSEPPTLTVEDKNTQKRLDKLADDGLHATLLEADDVCSGLGGVYLKVCWDKALDSRPWLSSVHADAAVPEFRYGRLVAVTFWRHVFENGGQIIRHLERHEVVNGKGVILHGLYDGGRDTLGKSMDLKAFPETRGLDPVVETGIDMLTADYIPNVRPAKVWRNHPAGAYLGRADFSGAEPFMDALDEVYSSWMRDIRHAKARLIVGENALENLGRGSGARFDPDREVYESIASLNPGDVGIEQVQFRIRTEDHRQAAQHFLDKVVQMSGYSTQTFGEDDQGAASMTATETRARQQRSYITRDKKIMYRRPPLARMIEAMLAVDRAQFGSGVDPERPKIEFGDTVSESPLTLAQTAQALRAAEAASDETLVQLVNPDWGDTQVKAEVKKIQAERQASTSAPGFHDVPGPDAGMGLPGPGAPNDQMPADLSAYGG